MTEINEELSAPNNDEAGCFITLIVLSILFVLWSVFSSYGDLTDKQIQGYKENSVRIMPQMEEIEQSLPSIEKRIKMMENRLPKDEIIDQMEQTDEPED